MFDGFLLHARNKPPHSYFLKHRTPKKSLCNFPVPNPDCSQQFNKRLLQSAKPLLENKKTSVPAHAPSCPPLPLSVKQAVDSAKHLQNVLQTWKRAAKGYKAETKISMEEFLLQWQSTHVEADKQPLVLGC